MIHDVITADSDVYYLLTVVWYSEDKLCSSQHKSCLQILNLEETWASRQDSAFST